jgi:hypothetical protein
MSAQNFFFPNFVPTTPNLLYIKLYKKKKKSKDASKNKKKNVWKTTKTTKTLSTNFCCIYIKETRAHYNPINFRNYSFTELNMVACRMTDLRNGKISSGASSQVPLKK